MENIYFGPLFYFQVILLFMVNIFLIEKIIVVLINLVGFWLLFLVYFSNKKEKLNQWFVAMTLFVILWIDFAFLGYSTDSIQSALIFYRLNFGSVTLFLICSFYFYFIYFLKFKDKYKILKQTVLSFGIILFVLSVFTNFIVENVVMKTWGAEIIFGFGNILFNIYSVFVGTVIIIFLAKKYFKSRDKAQKIKTKYFLFGTLLFILLNIIFNVFFPIISDSVVYQHFGDYSAIFLLIFTAYAITKHELMGIKTLIVQTLIAVISIVLAIDLLLLTDNITMQLLKSGILAAFLYFSQGMVESVKKEKRAREELENSYKKVDKYVAKLEDTNIELKEKNEDFEALLDASDMIVGSLNSEKIAQDVVNSVPVNLKYLGYKGAILVLYNRKEKTVHTCAITESSTVKKARKLLGKSFKNHSEPIGTDNFVTRTIKTKKMQTGSKLKDFITPTVSASTCGMIQKLVGAKSFVSLPIFSSRKIIGAIIFVGTKPEKEITRRDRDILFGFSSHIGASIENAELYEKTDIQMKELGKLNNSLKKANHKLEELVEVKNEFLHITSHQLRTPLTAIRGMISMWYEGSFDHLSKKKRREILKNICISTERLNNITNDMLDSIELEGGVFKFQFKELSLEKIIKESMNILKFNYDKKGLYLNFDTKSENIPTIEAEPNYVRQIFLNLIDNACKYTNEGGVNISVRKSGKYAEITVKDTGIGVSEKDRKKIFQKFTRSKEAMLENASGSGLGLFIVEKVVKAHYGKIEFFSKGKGKGSTVKVYLFIKQE